MKLIIESRRMMNIRDWNGKDYKQKICHTGFMKGEDANLESLENSEYDYP